MTAAQPRLTRLELLGFKSFANRTVFTFDRGITAVIGPNGSGKSNISDAVRWVLGEQSHSTLRSKKTEDVIFAGGNGKAPAGMAEVAVTFDNSTGWLPTEFNEVTVCRRAFRTGENQYLINGRKVRLKDVAHLTASLGHSHTVVGQGLVDAALSQRPEERRGLFEHAADLTGLRMKAVEAERNLAETQANSARIEDLLTELEPRLKTLERAARQAREWKGVHDRLRELQRFHYARLLADANQRLHDADEAAERESSALGDQRGDVEQLVTETHAARERLEAARAALEQHGAHLQSATDSARKLGYERDLANERLLALTKRREDMADTQSGLDDQVANVVKELESVTADLVTLSEQVSGARDAVTTAQAGLAAIRLARGEGERAASAVDKRISEAERRASELARRKALLEQRQQTDREERARLERTNAERAERIERLNAELAAFDQADETGKFQLAGLEAALTELTSHADAAAVATISAQNTLAELERTLGQTATRFAELKRIHDSGAGLHAGVRETTQAARRGDLQGIRGTVAELIEVPKRFDTAIEVALGGHLQDIVVEKWAHAEAAIAHLKRTGVGRATFQPLDTVRAGRPRKVIDDALAIPGVEGFAAELIGAPNDVDAVIASLLGRTLVVRDLDVARACLPHLPSGWSAVTLTGEITRTGGSVTGGAAVRESGMLGRERELKELPNQIKRLEKERDAAKKALQEANEKGKQFVEERRRIETERAALVASRKERGGQRARLAGWQKEVQAEHAGFARRLRDLDAAALALAADLDKLLADQTALDEEREGLLAELARVRQGLEAGTAELTAAEETLNAAERDAIGLDERLRSERKRESALLAQRRGLDEEMSLRAQRAATLEGEITAVASQRERLAHEAEQLAAARDAALADRPPLELEVKSAEEALTKLETALEAGRSALLDAERHRGVSGLAVERIRGELAAVRQRISDELELAEPDDLLTEDIVQPEGAADPVEAEREIARLKDRLRRVGYVGENVVEEYDREAERHAFLRQQLDDVHGASASLHKLLDELHQTMRERFDETFNRVATEFTGMFTTLFGGGTARLVMTASQNGDSGGIDIVAQPPGKRLQSLSLLSGGERALTAAAILFAILKVNPTPFCLLDEVDAALDEANIVRFREQLQALAEATQAIIITHNRGTIEVADTLYGVSMRDDGVSQVLSLRLADVPIAAD